MSFDLAREGLITILGILAKDQISIMGLKFMGEALKGCCDQNIVVIQDNDEFPSRIAASKLKTVDGHDMLWWFDVPDAGVRKPFYHSLGIIS